MNFITFRFLYSALYLKLGKYFFNLNGETMHKVKSDLNYFWGPMFIFSLYGYQKWFNSPCLSFLIH